MLSLVAEIYRHSLRPLPPFTWFGLGTSSLDILGIVRLCVVLRQLREASRAAHIKTHGKDGVEEESFGKKLATTLLIVYGGEALTAPLLGYTPSFMLSGVIPGLCALGQAIVEYLPAVPVLSAETELPLALLDGFTRAYMLCSAIPPLVVTHSAAGVSTSPWTLLVTSLIAANAGFFMINLFSFLNPTPLSIQTPPELQVYGWTTADVWCAPVGTALYALLTHAQPFWAELHSVLSQLLGAEGPVKPLDPEHARAICASLLSTLFVGRTMKNFGLWNNMLPAHTQPKMKTQ